MTAALIAVIAHGASLELARGRIAASVVAATGSATTIAFLAGLDDAITTLLAHEGGNIAVVSQASRPDRVATKCRAYIAYTTRREVGNAL